jgi:hypothetical protein
MALLLASLALGACGSTGGSGQAGAVEPFSRVEVGRTHIAVSPDGRSATVVVDTNPATVCAVAYGRTASLGSIADDPNMGGTAIEDHKVVLSGLLPGRTYRYRLTATDARGRVFQTPRLLEFSTPRRVAGAGHGPQDIAVGAKVVAVSSQFSSAYAATNAVDGNLATQWSSAGDGNKAFITIDLGRPRRVTGVAFITRSMADGSSITRTFAVVVDGRHRYGPFPAGSPADPRVAHVAFTGRLVRFQVVQSSGGNTGADEVEVFSNS